MNQENKKKILFYYSCFLQVNTIGEAKTKRIFFFIEIFTGTSTGTQHMKGVQGHSTRPDGEKKNK